MKNNSKNKGFSLIELSVVLAVISIALGSGLLTFNKYSEQGKVQETRDKMRYITHAILNYARANNSLPCPADGTLTNQDEELGIGDTDAACASANLDYGTGEDQVFTGMLPIVNLGLSPSLALDAWGNRFTYAIAASEVTSLSTPAISGDTLFVRVCSGSQYMRNIAGFLLSHGENGYGAWPGRGGSRKSTTGATTAEIRNATPSSSCAYNIPEFAGSDDIIFPISRAQLTQDSLGLLYDD